MAAIADLPLSAASADGTTITTPEEDIDVPRDLRAAVRAQRLLREGATAEDERLLPHSPKALAYSLTDASADLGLHTHGRIAERSTLSDVAWLKKLDIVVRPLP